MKTVRALLVVAAGGALGVAVGFLILALGAKQAGVWLAVAAGLGVVYGLVRYIDDQSQREYARRRDAEWQRRVRETRSFHVIQGGLR